MPPIKRGASLMSLSTSFLHHQQSPAPAQPSHWLRAPDCADVAPPAEGSAWADAAKFLEVIWAE